MTRKPMTRAEKAVIGAAMRWCRAVKEWDIVAEDPEGHGGDPMEWFEEQINATERDLENACARLAKKRAKGKR